MFLAVDDEVEVELRSAFEVSDEGDSKVGHLEEVEVVHLLLYCICHLCLHDLVLDENLPHCLLSII